jgi:hypothetical protein
MSYCKSDLSKLAEQLAFWVDCFEEAEQNQVAVCCPAAVEMAAKRTPALKPSGAGYLRRG